MSEELCRKAFVKWAESQGQPIDYKYSRGYLDAQTDTLWEGWQAAWSTRPAPVIDGKMVINREAIYFAAHKADPSWPLSTRAIDAAIAAYQAALGKEGK